MLEVPPASRDHGDVVRVAGGDHLAVAQAAAGLDVVLHVARAGGVRRLEEIGVLRAGADGLEVVPAWVRGAAGGWERGAGWGWLRDRSAAAGGHEAGGAEGRDAAGGPAPAVEGRGTARAA